MDARRFRLDWKGKGRRQKVKKVRQLFEEETNSQTLLLVLVNNEYDN